MTIDLRGTTLQHYDTHGGAVVRLQTNVGDFGTSHRAFTQSDRNAFFGTKVANPVVPTPVSLYDARLDQGTIAELNGNPGILSGRADDALFTRLRNLRPDGLRIMAGHTPVDSPWDEMHDNLWLDAAAGSKAQIVGLVAHPQETRDTLEQRLRDAERTMLNKPDDDQRPVVPVISTSAKKFVDLVNYVFERDLPAVGFEFHGLTRSKASMGYFHRVMQNAAVTPWAFGINVPRQHADGHGSGTLVAASYGVQSLAPSVFYGNPTGDNPKADPDDPRKMWWFHQPWGGYERYNALGQPEAGCPCPNGASQSFNPNNLSSMLAARRRHETTIHMVDQANYVRRVAAQDYTGYLDERASLMASLASLP
jgi:hypothetical protein